MNTVLPLLTCLLALRPVPEAGRDRAQDVAAQVAAILQRAERPADAAPAVRELVALGDAAYGPLFDRLVANQDDGVARRAAILGALASAPSERLLGFVQELARHPGDGTRRRAGLDLLGRFGGRDAFPLALELFVADDPSAPPDEELRTAFENALVGLVTREPGTARALIEYFSRGTPTTRASIVEAFTRVGGPGAVGWLAELLGRGEGDSDALLLLRIGCLARVYDPCRDEIVLEHVRANLGHPDARLVVLASVATVALFDDGAVPDLIVLLDDTRPNVPGAAHAALLELTGLKLAADSEDWLPWLDEGLAWWDERADGCRVALGSGEPTEAAAALQEVAHQRLFVHELVPMLQLALQRAEPDQVRVARTALSALPARAARAALAEEPVPALDARARAVLGLADHSRSRVSRERNGIPSLSRTP